MTVMLKPGIVMIPLTEAENTVVYHTARNGEKTVQIRDWNIPLKKIKAYGNLFPVDAAMLKDLLVHGTKDTLTIYDPKGRKYTGMSPQGNYSWDYCRDVPVRDMTLKKSYETAVAAMCAGRNDYIVHGIIFTATSVNKSVTEVAEDLEKPVVVIR